MSKGQAVRRFSSGRKSPLELQEAMTALLKEAHLQQKHGRGSYLSEGAEIQHHQMSFRSPFLPDEMQTLLIETTPQRRLSDLVLNKDVQSEMSEFIHEFSQSALLRSHSLEPKHTMLLVGPPGTGKTSLASAIAAELALPFLTVRYDGLVGSFLGETASRLQKVIDYAARTPCVLFFDEFDSVGKERSDVQETGEIKRVVSTLLLQMDALTTNCVIVCATNHPELLDRAVWRRFEVRVELLAPGPAELKDWYLRTERSFGSLEITGDEFISIFNGETLSEVEAVTLDARRKYVLSRGSLSPADAFKEALARWQRRRAVGGALFGSGANCSNKPRASRSKSKAGQKTLLSEADVIRGADKAP